MSRLGLSMLLLHESLAFLLLALWAMRTLSSGGAGSAGEFPVTSILDMCCTGKFRTSALLPGFQGLCCCVGAGEDMDVVCEVPTSTTTTRTETTSTSSTRTTTSETQTTSTSSTFSATTTVTFSSTTSTSSLTSTSQTTTSVTATTQTETTTSFLTTTSTVTTRRSQRVFSLSKFAAVLPVPSAGVSNSR